MRNQRETNSLRSYIWAALAAEQDFNRKRENILGPGKTEQKAYESMGQSH